MNCIEEAEQPYNRFSDVYGESRAGKASLFCSALNIANSIKGTGILALPSIIRHFGFLYGPIIIITSCILTYITSVLLIKCKDISVHNKYSSIGKACFGSKGLWIAKFTISLHDVGICVAYLMIFSEILLNLTREIFHECLIEETFLHCQPRLYVGISAILVLPFIFASSLSNLRRVSIAAMTAAILFTTSIIVKATIVLGDRTSSDIPKHLNATVPQAFTGVNSIFLAFTFQFNFFPIFKSLRHPTNKRMKTATFFGLFLVLILYLKIAIGGYILFGDDTDNLLRKFTRNNLGRGVYELVNISFLVSSILTWPMVFYGAKCEVYAVINHIRMTINARRNQGNQAQESVTGGINHERYEIRGFKLHIFELILFLVMVLVAMIIPKIDRIISFIGSTAGNGLNYILPTLFYLRLSSNNWKMQCVAIVILYLALVMGIGGMISSILYPESNS